MMRNTTQTCLLWIGFFTFFNPGFSQAQTSTVPYPWEVGLHAFNHLYSNFEFGPYEEDLLWLPGGYVKRHLPYGLSVELSYMQFHQTNIFRGIGSSHSQVNNHSFGFTVERTHKVKSYWGYHYGLQTLYSSQNEDHHGYSDVPPHYYESEYDVDISRVIPVAGINFFIKDRISIRYQVQYILYSYKTTHSLQSIFSKSSWFNDFMGWGTLSLGIRFWK